MLEPIGAAQANERRYVRVPVPRSYFIAAPPAYVGIRLGEVVGNFEIYLPVACECAKGHDMKNDTIDTRVHYARLG